jgi:hypothetical protein
MVTAARSSSSSCPAATVLDEVSVTVRLLFAELFEPSESDLQRKQQDSSRNNVRQLCSQKEEVLKNWLKCNS